jgi:hypothetical protein
LEELLMEDSGEHFPHYHSQLSKNLFLATNEEKSADIIRLELTYLMLPRNTGLFIGNLSKVVRLGFERNAYY